MRIYKEQLPERVQFGNCQNIEPFICFVLMAYTYLTIKGGSRFTNIKSFNIFREISPFTTYLSR